MVLSLCAKMRFKRCRDTLIDRRSTIDGEVFQSYLKGAKLKTMIG